MPKTTVSAAIYARVSTEEQAQHGTSIGEQVRRCRAQAEADGHTQIDDYVDDGISGASRTRPALDKLLEAVGHGEVDTVYVTSVDRLSRTTVHALTLVEDLAEARVGLEVLDQPGDQATASGRLSTGIYAVVAQHERERLIERVTAGLKARVREGGWPGGRAPYGYKIVDAPGGQGKVLEIDDEEYEVVRKVWRMLVVEQMTTGQAAKALDEAGHRSRQGGRWSTAKVRHAVKNVGPAWAGTWHYGTDNVPVTIPAIMSVAEQDALMEVMDSRSTTVTTNNRYLLSGRVTSPHGVTMQGVPSANTRWYRCPHRFVNARPDGIPKCDCSTVHAPTADSQVWAVVADWLTRPGMVASMLNPPAATDAEDTDAQIEALDRKTAAIETQAADELADLLDEGVNPRVAARAGRRHDEQITELARQRGRLASVRAARARKSVTDEDLVALVDDTGQDLATVGFDLRLRAVRLLDVQVQVNGWDECSLCEGRGLISRELAKEVGVPVGRHGVVCPECHRSRAIPRLKVQMVTLETDPEQGRS